VWALEPTWVLVPMSMWVCGLVSVPVSMWVLEPTWVPVPVPVWVLVLMLVLAVPEELSWSTPLMADDPEAQGSRGSSAQCWWFA
jgi:hypothetical protein